jgi:hypothetical protein
MSYTNKHDIPLPLAIWLATDNYDYDSRENSVSATTLLNPIKSTILSKRVEYGAPTDIMDLVPARLGSAIHDSVEMSIRTNYLDAMANLDIPKKVIDTVQIDPHHVDLEFKYDISLEQRHEKEIDGFVVTGKFDIVEAGRVKDIKTTKTYNWIKGGNDDKYMKQGSIYRWLAPHLITDDKMDVLMLFTDWNPLKAIASKDYPKNPIMTRTLDLMSIDETQSWIESRLDLLRRFWDCDQSEIPECTPEELWQEDTTYAWYKDPSKLTRSTKNFDSYAEAQAHSKGVGIIVERPGSVKFCNYCNASSICLQAERYREQGLLKD